MSLYISDGGILLRFPVLGSWSVTSSITFSCWIKVDAINAATDRTIIQLQSLSLDNLIALRINTSNQVEAHCRQSTGTTGTSTTTNTVNAGVWHHVAGVFSGTSFRQAWLDGSPATSNTTSVVVSATAVHLSCGGTYTASSGITRSLAGVIAFPAIYYSYDVASAGRLSNGEVQRLARIPPHHMRKRDLYWCPDLEENVTTEEGGSITCKTLSFRSAHSQFAEEYLLDSHTFVSCKSSKDNPPALAPRTSFSMARFAFPDINNKLRSQAAFLKPYTGILPIANG